MSAPRLLNAAGRRRSPVTLPGYLAGRPPRNKGLRYPPDPPMVEEIVAVMRQAGDGVHGARMRAFIVLRWRAGLRINEALTVTEHDLEPRAGSVLVRHGKGGRRREVGMDPWGWDHLRPWLELRIAMPVGPLLCVIDGPTRGRRWASDSARAQLRRAPRRPRCGGGSPRTSCATPTPSNSPTRASRSTSSRGNLGIPTLGSRPSICKASTTPRSLPPSTPARHR
jgi:integrase